MIYTEMTVKAMKTAYAAHLGQTDKGDVPYVFHPFHVAEQMDDEISCTVALLHDVVEDTPVTLEALGEEFPPAVIEAVGLLTHGADTPYFTYLSLLKANPVAKKVKLADIAHNSDQTRLALSGLSPEEMRRLAEKYEKARAFLLS